MALNDTPTTDIWRVSRKSCKKTYDYIKQTVNNSNLNICSQAFYAWGL